MARIQSDAVQLALDLLVREPDIAGFFRVFIKTLVEESESHACGVWLLDDERRRRELRPLDGVRRRTASSREAAPDWDTLALPSESMSAHLLALRARLDRDDRIRRRRRAPARAGPRTSTSTNGIESVLVAPLVLPTRNLGWFALSSAPRADLRGRLAPRAARGDGAAGHAGAASEPARRDSRSEERRQAVLEERNRLARDIHDTLAQGFAAILMQLQAAQRAAGSLPAAVARSIETAVDLARTHMIEARRSVGALRPQRPRPRTSPPRSSA